MALVDPNTTQTPNEAINAMVQRVAEHQTYSRDYLPKLFADDENLTELLLPNTNCGDVPVTALADALKVNKNLVKLNLEANGITCDGAIFLADAIEQNSILREVNLKGNYVGTRGIKALSSALEKNNSLRVLELDDHVDVGDNDEGPFIDAEALQELRMMTKLNSHPPQLKKAILSLKWNQAGELINLSRSADAAAEHRDLKHDDRVHVDDWGIATLADFLAENTTVTELDLSHQHIGDVGAKSLADMLLKNRNLDRIDLRGNNIATQGAEHLIEALKDNSSLRYLSLYKNSISEQVVVDVEKAVTLNRQPLSLKHNYMRLLENDPTLVHIVLDDHLSQRFYDDISARLLTEALTKNTALISLAVNNSHISAVGARFMGDLLSINQTLQVLDLSHNPLKDGTKHITNSLFVNNTLVSLRLSDTNMPDPCAKLIAEMLETNTTLTDLDLSDNEEISEAGAAFAHTFNMNTTIKSFNLDGTSIAPKVLNIINERRRLGSESKEFRDVLHKVVQQNPSLTVIALGGDGQDCVLRDTSLRILSPALQNNFYVTVLDISHNAVGYHGISALCHSLMENTVTMEELNISHNPINHGYELGKLLAKVMQVHKRLVKINAANTGLDNDGCEEILHVVDVPRFNVVKDLDISQNPEISAKVAFKVWLYIECNSLLLTFKERVRRFYHQWEDNDARAVYEEVADFSNYDRNDAPANTSPALFNKAAYVTAQVMRMTKGYHVLRFNNNRLGDDGVSYFAALLQEDRGIKSIDLSDNLITDDAVEPLCAAVKHGFDVTEVKLENNSCLSPDSLGELEILLLYNQQPRPIKELLVKVNRNDPSMTKIDFSDRLTDHLQDHHVRLVCDALKTNSHVTWVDLSNNHIKLPGLQCLVSTMENHSGIERFLLRNTLIEGAEVGELIARLLSAEKPPLTHLDFSYNSLNESIAPPILKAISENRNVKFLGLNDCGLSEKVLSQLTNSVSLNTQHVLKDLVPQLKANDPEITAVDGSGAGYQDSHVIEVALALTNNTVVTEVDFSGNGLTDVAGVEIMCSLWGNKGVKRLNLSQNKLTGTTVAALKQLLKHNECLEVVDFSSNLVTQESLEELQACALEDSWSLAEVIIWPHEDISKAPFTKETIHFFQEMLTLNRQHGIKRALPLLRADAEDLTELDASTDKNHCDVGCEHLAGAIMANSHLTTLCLSGGVITDVGVKHLCRALDVNSVVSTLDLSNNKIGDDGVRYLADMLKTNRGLKKLSLKGNTAITESGGNILHAVLLINDTLRELDITECPGVTAEIHHNSNFAMTLNNKHKNIKELLRNQEDIVYSELNFSNAVAQGRVFDNEACEILVSALKYNKFVTKLNLSHNDLTFEAGYILHDLLIANTRITELNLAHNAINDGSMQIVDAVSKNNHIISLNLNNNGCSSLSMDMLNLYLQLNREPLPFKKEVLKIMEKDITHSISKVNIPEIHFVENRKPQLDDESMQFLTSMLRTDLVVRELDLSWNAVGDAGLESVVDLLRHNNGIHTVKLAHNFLQDQSVMALCAAGSKMRGLTRCDFSFNSITSAVVSSVKKLLVDNERIVEFRLEGNNKIEQKDLNEINFLADVNEHCGGDLRQALLDAFHNEPQALELVFTSAVSMGLWNEHSCRLIGFCLTHSTTVKSLTMEFNDITEQQLGPLCDMLRVNTALETISLANNHLVDVSELFDALRCNTTVKHVDLRKNNMNRDSAKQIADYLRDHDSLEELDVSFNDWGRSGVSVIASALPMNDGLKKIDVSGEGIPMDAVEAAEHAISLHYKGIQLKALTEAPLPATGRAA